MTTGIIVGEGIGGTTNKYLTNKLYKTGEAGKRVGIGRNNKRGVSKVCDTERVHNNPLEGCNHREPVKKGPFNSNRRQVHNPAEANNSTYSSNREPMKKEKENNKTERVNNSTQSTNREARKAGGSRKTG
jgi:hypothetical protein